MKKCIRFIACLCISYSYADIQDERKEHKTSQSFYWNAPLNSVGLRYAGAREEFFSSKHTHTIRAYGAYTKSFSSTKMAQFFLKEHKEELIIRGSEHELFTDYTTDVRADWLGLPNNFEGTLSLSSSYETYGITFSARTSLKDFLPYSFFKRSSLFCELPIVHTKTDLDFTQSKISNAAADTDPVYDILTAFNNSEWKFQKIRTTHDKTTQLTELRLGFAKTFISNHRALLSMTSAISIPTMRSYKNEYMFEAHGGLHGHAGIISSVHINAPLTLDQEPFYCSFFLDAEHTLVVRSKQYRTFDLKDKQWSRFMQFRKKDELADVTYPGVNILTQKVRISPYSMFDVLAGFRFKTGSLDAEIGFGAWGHPHARIKFTETFDETYGIAGTAANYSASASTINTLAANDTNFTPIFVTDLNISSAVSPSKVIYKAHGSASYHYHTDSYAGYISLILQIQIPRNHTNGFKTWSLGLSAGTGF